MTRIVEIAKDTINTRLMLVEPELTEIVISNAEYRAARDSEFGRGYNAAKNQQRRDKQKESTEWFEGYDAYTSIIASQTT